MNEEHEEFNGTSGFSLNLEREGLRDYIFSEGKHIFWAFIKRV